MDPRQQKKIVEALIVAAAEPVSPQRLAQIVPGLKPAGARKLVEELGREYDEQDRAFEIWEVAGGFQIRTRAEYAGHLRQLHAERPLRLSRAALETLAVVAYKQPVTRAEIEQVRGVDVGAVVRSLLDRKLVRVAGHREVPGRPMLYATTRRFLEVFGLHQLEDLPTPREIEELLPPRSGLPEGAEGAGAPEPTGEPIASASVGEATGPSAEALLGETPPELH